MKIHVSPIRIFGHLFSIAAIGLMGAEPALASPMRYTATLVTDIKVGNHRYHNAEVAVTFVGDTSDITPAPVTSILCSSDTEWFFLLDKGSASFSLQSQGQTLSGRFNSGEIFVALDKCNGGIGLGSYTGPKGMEVAYPVGFELGTAMAVAFTSGLSSEANMSGNAWSCIGYPPNDVNGPSGTLPGNGCAPPDAYPLHSDVGDVFIYMPYTLIYSPDGSIEGNHIGSLNRGTFAITHVLPAGVRDGASHVEGE